MIIRSRAPLRIGIAGGGSDVSPYCDIFGGSVLNATIDLYAYVTLKPLSETIVRFIAADMGITCCFSSCDSIPESMPLRLHAAVYSYIMRTFNNGHFLSVEIHTFCDAPPGSGLGSSSTLVVAMIKAFAEWLNLSLDDYAVAQAAYYIERVDCGLRGGRQDQYSASFGGVSFMEFHPGEKVIVNPLRIRSWILCELESSLVLYFTGISRDSAAIIEAQSESLSKDKEVSLQAMHGVKQEAIAMKEALLKGDFSAMAESLRLGWDNKKKTAHLVSNPFIEQIFDAAIKAGALAGKVSGAGGGGFMLFLTPPECRLAVYEALLEFSGTVRQCHFTKQGVQSWRVAE